MSVDPEIRDLVAGADGTVSVYARNLTTGERVDSDGARVMATESAAKTFLLVTYCAQVRCGMLSPDRSIVIPDGFEVVGTGVLRYLRPNLALTLDDLAWLMTIVSDNIAAALLLLEVGGPDAVNTTMSSLDLPTARLHSFDDMAAGRGFGLSSARDLAETYTHLDDRALRMLSRQQDLIGLPRRLHHHPTAADFAHPSLRVFNKTGTGIGNFVDAGLFETPTAQWVVAVMTADQRGSTACPDDDAPALVGRIGRILFDAWG